MNKKVPRVRLPMVSWQELALRLDASALCWTLDVLRADRRTRSGLAAFAIIRFKSLDAKSRMTFGGMWRPILNAWGLLAYSLALQRIPLYAHVVRNLREILIETGSVSRLLVLDERYGTSVAGSELLQLTTALSASDSRYDWKQWDELERAAYTPDLSRIIRERRAVAVRDHDFDG